MIDYDQNLTDLTATESGAPERVRARKDFILDFIFTLNLGQK